jgi:hypothetical protein
MPAVQLLLYIVALMLLIAAAAGSNSRLGWAGMACWLAASVFVPLLH